MHPSPPPKEHLIGKLIERAGLVDQFYSPYMQVVFELGARPIPNSKQIVPWLYRNVTPLEPIMWPRHALLKHCPQVAVLLIAL